MSRVAPALTVSDDERIVLLRWSKGRRTPARLVRRAKIVLRAADGWLTAASAVELGTQEKTVGLCRRRLSAQGPAGIEQDASGRGRPATVQRGVIEADVVRKTTRERPPHATHWSTRSMAAALGISPASGRRIWKRHGLKPHLVRTFKVSNAPHFAEKLEDIVGLSLNPPEHALVFSVDEKSQIQALDRTQPGLPIKTGRAGTMTQAYKRHGTTTLFAALCTRTGHVISTGMPRPRHQAWIKCLARIDREAPPDLAVHLLGDNSAPHNHAKVQRWLHQASALPRPLHAHERLLAEHGGALVSRPHRQTDTAWHLSQRAGRHRRDRRVHLSPQRRSETVHLDQEVRRTFSRSVMRARATLDNAPSV